MTRKDVEYIWKPEHQKAFEEILKRLASPPVLAPHTYGKPYVVETDASKFALGACLLQENKGELHPVANASRATTKTESCYAAIELEALGICFALNEFKPYLEITSLVRTDSSALCALMKRRDLTGRLAKYQLAIQAYDIEIVHRSGRSNTFCAHLSRYVASVVQTVGGKFVDSIRKSSSSR